MPTKILPAAVFSLATAAFAMPATAHHSFAMFDSTKTVVLQGTVKEFQWTNPHVWLQVVVQDGDKGTKEYSVELASLNVLAHNGWKANSVKPGDKVEVSIHPLKNGDPGGSGEKVVLADGRTLSTSARPETEVTD